MKLAAAPAHRQAAFTGLVIVTAVGLWWIVGTRLALERSADAGRGALQALHALLLARGLVLAFVAPRLGSVWGVRRGVASTVALVAPAWPLSMLAWMASAAPAPWLLAAEALLLVAAVLLPLGGSALRRLLPRGGLAEPVATVIGCALAAGLWSSRGAWSLL